MSEPATIRDAATVALLRDGDTGLEVLLLRRHGGHVFGANAYVFPGGAVDEADAAADLAARCTADRSYADDQPLAYRMAAIRECFEEAGVLLACNFDGPASAQEIAVQRNSLNTDAGDWAWIVRHLDLRFNPDELIYFAYYLTPRGAPRRYATRFFAARAPDDQQARADGVETTHLEWLSPSAALARQDRDGIILMPPTQITLQQLGDYADVESALAGLARAGKRSA